MYNQDSIDYFNQYDENHWEDGHLVVIAPEEMDIYGWELLLYEVPQDQLEILVCRYLGMTPKQTVKVLQLKNIGKYYSLNYKLKDFYRKRKDQFI